jgi:hypothetical protein
MDIYISQHFGDRTYKLHMHACIGLEEETIIFQHNNPKHYQAILEIGC